MQEHAELSGWASVYSYTINAGRVQLEFYNVSELRIYVRLGEWGARGRNLF